MLSSGKDRRSGVPAAPDGDRRLSLAEPSVTLLNPLVPESPFAAAPERGDSSSQFNASPDHSPSSAPAPCPQQPPAMDRASSSSLSVKELSDLGGLDRIVAFPAADDPLPPIDSTLIKVIFLV